MKSKISYGKANRGRFPLFLFVICAACTGLVATAGAQGGAPITTCENLAKLNLPHVTITTAKQLKAGEFEFPPHPPGSGGYPSNMDEAKVMPAICTVFATLTPTPDSHINIEVWLPNAGWNGKFLSVGNGGWGGRISHAGMITGILRGYAGASSDSGHDVVEDNGSGQYVMGHPEKVADLGWRAVRETTVAAKAIIAAFFGAQPKHSYFVGSRLGGYQGLVEAERYPEDYDGIIAESPQVSFALSNAAGLWGPWLLVKNPEGVLSKDKLTMVHDAVLQACDELDGVKDGILENPLACNFVPKSLLCKQGETAQCLTAAQLQMLEKLYQGPVNPRTGKVLLPGPALGAELSMTQAQQKEPHANSIDLFRYMVAQKPAWDWTSIDWDQDVSNAERATASNFDLNRNLNAYIKRGGKALVYMPWAGSANPSVFLEYWREANQKAGADAAAGALRMFLVPGDFREAPFDKISLLEQWVEQGKAPAQIVASYDAAAGKPARTHLLCVYPAVAKYDGKGDANQAQSYSCQSK